jgi:hypothetical protein
VIVSGSGPCCTCEGPSGPVIVQGSAEDPTAPKGLRGRLANLFGKSTPAAGEVVVITPSSPPVTTVAQATPAATPPLTTVAPTSPIVTPMTPPAKVAVEAPRPSDWHESWGKPAPAKPEVVSTPKKDPPKAEVTVSTPKKDAPKPEGAVAPAKVPAPPPPPSPYPVVMTPPKSDTARTTLTVTAPANYPTAMTPPKSDLTSPRLKPAPLPVADTRHPDPLTQPETFSRGPVEARPPVVTTGVADRTGMGEAGWQTLPPGSRSVMDAGSPQYVPVPIVTMPDYMRPPEPPAPQVPKPPEPNFADVSNAFTNPAAPSPPAAPQPPVQANAFSPVPAPVDPTVAGAFGQPGAAAPMPGTYPPGYGPRMPGMYPPAAYGPMTRGIVPATQYGPGGPGGYPPYPPGMVPAAYPPTPAMPPAQPAAPAPGIRPASYEVAAAGHPRPSAPGLPSGGTSSLTESLATLRDSLYPSQREWAANALASYDWRTHPDAVHGLLLGAREDPAPSVRAACVRALARMKADSAPVVSALQAMQNDGDPRVLHEVESALATLTAERTAR